MKKIIAIFLTLCLSAGLAACSDDSRSEAGSSAPQSSAGQNAMSYTDIECRSIETGHWQTVGFTADGGLYTLELVIPDD